MKVMVLIKANADSEAEQMPSSELRTAMGAYNEELMKAGIMLGGDGLKSSAKGARVHFGVDGSRTVQDGPFAETKELLAGYWIWEVKSLEEAIEWVKKIPNHGATENSHVEIRPIFGTEDFDQEHPAIQREHEMRAELEAKNKV